MLLEGLAEAGQGIYQLAGYRDDDTEEILEAAAITRLPRRRVTNAPGSGTNASTCPCWSSRPCCCSASGGEAVRCGERGWVVQDGELQDYLFLFAFSPTPLPVRVSQKGHAAPCPYVEAGYRGISYP